jgi:uncharacterized protein YbaP (TraB family)
MRWGLCMLRMLALVGLLSAGAVSAQTLPMWEISKDGRSGYLVATLHVGRPEFFPLPPPIRKAFEWAEVVAVEIDSSRPENQKAITESGMYPEGSTIEQVLGAAEWEKLRPLLDRLNLGVERAQKMRPWLLASMMTVLAQADAGFNPELGIDAALLRVARSSGRKVVELERFADQAAVLAELSEKHGKLWVTRVASLIESGKAGDSISQTVDAWRAGDLQQMQRVIAEETSDEPAAAEIAQRIARSRGSGIARAIGTMHASGARTVYAVHIANLAGPDGVAARLAADGFRLRQVTVESEIPDPPGSKGGTAPAPAREPSGKGNERGRSGARAAAARLGLSGLPRPTGRDRRARVRRR